MVLADEEDENLANCLIRSGAQDVLLKSELECGLLARSIRYAVERHRRSSADPALCLARPESWTGQDSLRRAAFFAAGFSNHIDTHLAILDIRDLPAETSEEREARELFLMRAADVLQDTLPAPVLIGRLEKTSFALILAGMGSRDAEALVARAAGEIEDILQAVMTATVSFSVHELAELESLETKLNDGQGDGESLWPAKPVMLAD